MFIKMTAKLITGEGDRRIQKTKRLISDALKTLLIEKEYEAITIQEIIDRANVGRSTFYSHYESKEHLLVAQESIEKLLTEIGACDDDGAGNGAINFIALYRHVKENAQLAKA